MASVPTNNSDGSKPRRDPPGLRPRAPRLLAITLPVVGTLKAAEPEVADPAGPESDEAQAILPQDNPVLWKHVELKRQFTERGTPEETSRTTLGLGAELLVPLEGASGVGVPRTWTTDFKRLVEEVFSFAGDETRADIDNTKLELPLRAALEKVKLRVRPAPFEIFYLHVVKERPVKEVAATLEGSAAQIYLAPHRVGRLLKSEVLRLQKSVS